MIDLSTKIDIKSIGLTINRFWSSPKKLPFINIVTVVLARPTFDDVKKLTDKFGVELVKKAYKISLEEGEFSKGEIKYADKFLRQIERDITEYNTA